MKKLTLFLLLLSPFLQNAWALGLGKTTLHSYVGQPLNASIAITDGNLNDENLRISLADDKDYQRLNIDKKFNHYDLQFGLDNSEPTKPRIKISSSKPITEPFLYFAITIKSPEGNLVKAITLLLPTPSKQSAQSVLTP